MAPPREKPEPLVLEWTEEILLRPPDIDLPDIEPDRPSIVLEYCESRAWSTRITMLPLEVVESLLYTKESL